MRGGEVTTLERLTAYHAQRLAEISHLDMADMAACSLTINELGELLSMASECNRLRKQLADAHEHARGVGYETTQKGGE